MRTSQDSAPDVSENRSPHGGSELSFLWLEITRACNLECVHCYSDSSPRVPVRGQVTTENWQGILRDAYALGCRHVQFIGGEPTVHPDFESLLGTAVSIGLDVEVYTNLTTLDAVRARRWKRLGVTVATSFYDCEPHVHDAITRSKGSFGRTVRGLRIAKSEYLPIRVGVVRIDEDADRAARTDAYLHRLGITEIASDRIRRVGRGRGIANVSLSVNGKPMETDIERPDLCGQCWKGRLCVTSDGAVYPCIMARSCPVGNVRTESLASILGSSALSTFRRQVRAAFPVTNPVGCDPWSCDPNRHCNPNQSCSPAEHCNPRRPCHPSEWCNPNAKCVPDA